MRFSLLATVLIASLSAGAFAQDTSILAPKLNAPSTAGSVTAHSNAGQWHTTNTTSNSNWHDSANNWTHRAAHSGTHAGGCCGQKHSCCSGIWKGYCKQRRSLCKRGCGCKSRAKSCGCKSRTKSCGCKSKVARRGCGNKLQHRMRHLTRSWGGSGCGCSGGCNRCRKGWQLPRMDWSWLSHCNRCRRPRHRCSCLRHRIGWNRGCGSCGRKSCSGCSSHGGHSSHAGCPLCKQGVPHTHGPVIEHKVHPKTETIKPVPAKPMPKPMPKKTTLEKSAKRYDMRGHGIATRRPKGLFDGINFMPISFGL